MYIESNRATIKDLNEGASYNFRVRAKNSVGLGEPTQTEHPAVAKDNVHKPDVDMRGLYMGSVSAKAGENIKIELPLIGK